MGKQRATKMELDAVKLAMKKETKVRVYRRYQALYFFLQGKTGKEAAEIAGLTAVTVSNIYRAYEREGLGAVQDKVRPGRPPRLNAMQQRDLCAWLRTQTERSVNAVTDYIRGHYGIVYTVRGVRKLLERLEN